MLQDVSHLLHESFWHVAREFHTGHAPLHPILTPPPWSTAMMLVRIQEVSPTHPHSGPEPSTGLLGLHSAAAQRETMVWWGRVHEQKQQLHEETFDDASPGIHHGLRLSRSWGDCSFSFHDRDSKIPRAKSSCFHRASTQSGVGWGYDAQKLVAIARGPPRRHLEWMTVRVGVAGRVQLGGSKVFRKCWNFVKHPKETRAGEDLARRGTGLGMS